MRDKTIRYVETLIPKVIPHQPTGHDLDRIRAIYDALGLPVDGILSPKAPK